MRGGGGGGRALRGAARAGRRRRRRERCGRGAAAAARAVRQRRAGRLGGRARRLRPTAVPRRRAHAAAARRPVALPHEEKTLATPTSRATSEFLVTLITSPETIAGHSLKGDLQTIVYVVLTRAFKFFFLKL